MHNRDGGSHTTRMRGTASGASRSTSPRSGPASQSNVIPLTPRLKQRADQAAGDDRGHPAMFRENVDGFLSPFEAAVKKSQGAFVVKLVEYHATLYTAANTDTDSDRFEASVEEALFAAHRIAGVGKTLGFGELGDAARKAEVAISAYQKNFGSAERYRRYQSRICQLARMIEAICADHDGFPA